MEQPVDHNDVLVFNSEPCQADLTRIYDNLETSSVDVADTAPLVASGASRLMAASPSSARELPEVSVRLLESLAKELSDHKLRMAELRAFMQTSPAPASKTGGPSGGIAGSSTAPGAAGSAI